MMLTILAVSALSLQLLAPYLIWPSRWNVPTHLAAGFCVAAYVIPGFFTNVWENVPEYAVNRFVLINVFGAISICLGMLFAALINKSSSLGVPNFYKGDIGSLIGGRRVLLVNAIVVIGIYISYIVMGFTPLFSEDPYSARQFKGVYRDPYYRAAYLYRFCFSIIHLTMPLLLVLAWQKRSMYLGFLAALALLALLLSLSRGPMANGILLAIGVIAATKRGAMKLYIPIVIIVFPLGSIFFYVLGQFLQSEVLSDAYIGESLSEYISAGAPDIADQLQWVHGFMNGNFFTYGRTIFGGLVPGNYEWNPSIWTISYADIGADVSETVTGGLRLTTAEWGYANFGWMGVLIIPFVSGFFNALMLIYLRDVRRYMNVVQIASAFVVYSTLGLQIVQFYFLSIHNIPAILAGLYFWYSNYASRGPVDGGVDIPSVDPLSHKSLG